MFLMDEVFKKNDGIILKIPPRSLRSRDFGTLRTLRLNEDYIESSGTLSADRQETQLFVHWPRHGHHQNPEAFAGAGGSGF